MKKEINAKNFMNAKSLKIIYSHLILTETKHIKNKS